MDRYIINGGRKLGGRLRVHGAKNAVLPIIAATVLSGDKCSLYDCPNLSDVHHTIKILRTLGCRAELNGDILEVNLSNLVTRRESTSFSSILVKGSVYCVSFLTFYCRDLINVST